MKFSLEVDTDGLAGDVETELGRILRYWGGNLKYYDLTQPVEPVDVSDSTYATVGSWKLS